VVALEIPNGTKSHRTSRPIVVETERNVVTFDPAVTPPNHPHERPVARLTSCITAAATASRPTVRAARTPIDAGRPS